MTAGVRPRSTLLHQHIRLSEELEAATVLAMLLIEILLLGCRCGA
ncbi:hypothetical protein SAZ_08470 [Streptomyces noursei ZPM]|nr:hypothetical protein SAZ_08470 [Streptomyces noursei ZPM]EPY92535.1 hypothetical protein K530_52695 [Streptomyces noursei CCRC 11814]